MTGECLLGQMSKVTPFISHFIISSVTFRLLRFHKTKYKCLVSSQALDNLRHAARLGYEAKVRTTLQKLTSVRVACFLTQT